MIDYVELLKCAKEYGVRVGLVRAEFALENGG